MTWPKFRWVFLALALTGGAIFGIFKMVESLTAEHLSTALVSTPVGSRGDACGHDPLRPCSIPAMLVRSCCAAGPAAVVQRSACLI
eukprot:CAMPEP_0206214650 /NCGR_PEP_ID=MMETSP0047_2-20121206/1781_1 /ASSEMBLY_ACC=CAM_ASM_000192 /TAXON_ID=195065 /ORGANISM="Chroomonas mesostigmatica_cf, Strain CCMP1168" /LENGTH=85 /DNA_ID=CAMNT_0053636905 /DNA_START=627 /DNA_END=882 /DNA_ORIENTATION=+